MHACNSITPCVRTDAAAAWALEREQDDPDDHANHADDEDEGHAQARHQAPSKWGEGGNIDSNVAVRGTGEGVTRKVAIK